LILDEARLLRNTRTVQQRNDIEVGDEAAALSASELFDAPANMKRRFSHFGVEMETGTGKTYVYLRTIRERAALEHRSRRALPRRTRLSVREVGQIMTPKSRSPARLLMACLILAGCNQDPDLQVASARELVALAARAQLGEPTDSLANRAAQELLSRPRAAVVAELQVALGSEVADIRSWAARTLGEFLAASREPFLDPGARGEVETALHGLLADRDEGVRASALYGLGRGCVVRRPDTVPQQVTDSIRALLSSEVVGTRFLAALAASWFGPVVEPVADQLVTQVKTEADDGVRFMMATALGQVGAKDASAVDCLSALLDDPDEKVRGSAAASLGELGGPTPAVLQRLRRCFADAREAIDVRVAAADSLVILVTKADDAEPLLLALLDSHMLMADHRQLRWLQALGKVATLVPKTATASAARDRLEKTARAQDGGKALVATSGLARIACAERDRTLGQGAAAELRKALPAILVVAQEETGWSSATDEYQPALEALVELAQWPEMAIDASELHAVFVELQKHRFRWTRDWAREQSARLR